MTRYKTPEEYGRIREQVLQRYPNESGVSLAREFGITTRTIRQWVHDADLPRKKGGRPNPHAEKTAEVLRMYGAGANYAEIKQALNVSKDFVAKVIREAKEA